MGGTPSHGAYKGFGLGLVVDILSGILSGSTISTLAQTPPEARGNYSDYFFGALNIASFLPVDKFMEKPVDPSTLLREITDLL